jgi:hypothetical protein
MTDDESADERLLSAMVRGATLSRRRGPFTPIALCDTCPDARVRARQVPGPYRRLRQTRYSAWPLRPRLVRHEPHG